MTECGGTERGYSPYARNLFNGSLGDGRSLPKISDSHLVPCNEGVDSRTSEHAPHDVGRAHTLCALNLQATEQGGSG